MNRTRFVVGLVLASLLAGCNDSLPPEGRYATFKGVVLDSVSQQPVANATVIVDSVLQTTTANDGTFSIPNVPSGSVDFVVKAAGFTDYSDTQSVDPAGTLTLTVSMKHSGS
ncbi:MAG: carboxypeptidase regulatory-like domain-containing protein [Candidatus Eremiobacteraeota bacterium]|nr:carboxypeptidase regulatory-like domain-containing protein [Candidatus Eremiobacteraeota bacterium]